MIGTTINFCEKNSSAWSGISAFAGVLNAVKQKKKEVDEASEIAAVPTTGVTEDVRGLRKKMTEHAVRCGSGVLALANTIGDHDLAAKVNFTANKLKKMNRETATGHCQAIKDAAAANAGTLVGYGITASDIADLQTAIDKYRQKAPSPRLAIINRSKAKGTIAQTVRFILDDLLANRLDMMAGTLRFSNPYFYSGYILSREIIDLGVVHTKLKAFVTDQDQVPLEGAQLTVTETESLKVLKTAVSEKDGTVKINPMSVGNVDLKWEAEGYETKTETEVHVVRGKVLRRKVTMKKIADFGLGNVD